MSFCENGNYGKFYKKTGEIGENGKIGGEQRRKRTEERSNPGERILLFFSLTHFLTLAHKKLVSSIPKFMGTLTTFNLQLSNPHVPVSRDYD